MVIPHLGHDSVLVICIVSALQKKLGPYLERHAYAVAMHIRKRKSRGGKESVEKVLVASIKKL